jgi:hypothetical protein
MAGVNLKGTADAESPDLVTARATRTLARLTLALVLINAIYIGVSAWQLSIMRGQLNSMQIDQRPWVSATPAVEKFTMVQWNASKSVNVMLKISLHNYGRLPAQDFDIKWMIKQWPTNAHHGDLDAPKEKLCSDATRATTARRQKTLTVFPDRDATVEDNLTVGGVYLTNTTAIFSLYGCADYTYSSGEHGQTLFRYTLGKINHDIWTGLPFKKGTAPSNAPARFTWAALPKKDYDFKIDPDGGNYVR